jgi:hypothetical protein
MNKIKLHTIDTSNDVEMTDFFTKERIDSSCGLVGVFNGHYVGLQTALKRGFELAPDFQPPAVSTRVELARWLESKGISRVKNFDAYQRLYAELGRDLDAGIIKPTQTV